MENNPKLNVYLFHRNLYTNMRKVGLDRWVCMDCKKVKCTCVGGKNTVSTTPTDLPSVQVHTPAQCIRQQPRSTKC